MTRLSEIQEIKVEIVMNFAGSIFVYPPWRRYCAVDCVYWLLVEVLGAMHYWLLALSFVTVSSFVSQTWKAGV